jgi:hypothetical protein
MTRMLYHDQAAAEPLPPPAHDFDHEDRSYQSHDPGGHGSPGQQLNRFPTQVFHFLEKSAKGQIHGGRAPGADGRKHIGYVPLGRSSQGIAAFASSKNYGEE